MKKFIAGLSLFALVLISGCNTDTSGETRQVSTPNPEVKSPSAPSIASNPQIPDATKKSLAHVIPPAGPPASQTGG